MFAACKPATKERRNESRMIYVGIDVHKRKCQTALMTEKGTILDELSYENNQQGLNILIEKLQPHGEAKAVLESTGNFWLKTYEALEAAGIKTTLSNPLKTRAIAEARTKTDKIDARTLAHLLRADLVVASYVPDKETRARRTLLRHRAGLVKTRTELKNRIHNLLDKYDLKPEFSDMFGKQGREWLRNLQLSSTEKTILDVNLQQLESIEHAINKLTTQIAKEAVDRPDVKLLMGFTDIDYYSAMLLINEIEDVNRFPSADKLVSYAGLAPSQRQSADHTFHGHITRQGNRYIRWILIGAAQHASRFDPQLKLFCERIAARRGRQRAIVAVARKLLIYIYQVLRKQKPYRAQRDELVAKKLKRLEQRASSSLQAD
jgi:transposase